MKHLKTFEKLEEWNKETGHYVIMTETGDRPGDVMLRKFLESNIGQIKKMYYPGGWFDAKYDNVLGLPNRTTDTIDRLLHSKSQFHHQDILYI